MDRKERYQRIEFLNPNNEKSIDKINGPNIVVHEDDDDDDKEEERSRSSRDSSSPPNDFDINFESQYIPLFNESASPNQDDRLRSSSLASSISVENGNEYNTSPILLTSSTDIVRCPVCERLMRTYYCAKCIQRGQFVTIDTSGVDRFIETVIEVQNVSSSPDLETEEIDQENALEEMLQLKYRTLARKTEALKNLCCSQQLKLEQTKQLLKSTKDQLNLEKKSNKSKEGKIELMKRFISSRKSSIKKRRNAEITLIEDLRQYVSRRVYQLTNDIFPIEEVNLLEQSNLLVNMETSPLLTFSDGSHHQIEHQTAFSIVEPWLPSDGDYSSYSLWLNDNQDHIPASMSDLSERNPAFRIGAALSYTTQLVKNLATYLDVILPARMELDTFNRELMSDSQFSYNVAKLNSNIIYLCVSQGVDVALLHPQKTLKNLMLMFNLNISDIGRRPIIELDNEEAAIRIEEKLAQDLSLVQDSFYDFSKFIDDDDISDSDWEISDTINPIEMQMAAEQSIQQNSYISRLPLRLFASFWSTGS